MELSKADHSVSPPRVDIAREYNAAEDLIGRNLAAGRAQKIAYLDDLGAYSYGELARRVNRFASALATLGVDMEQRVMLAMLDTVDWPTAFLGAIRAGVVPVAANTLLTTKDYAFMLEDSRARVLFVSEALLPQFEPLLGRLPFLRHVVVSGKDAKGQMAFRDLLAKGKDEFAPAATTRDDACFWLYSSGSTGTPKGTVHVHSSMILTAELYAKPVLGIREDDVVFSAAKLFFAYGLGNGLSFPLSVGATTVLMAERPTPAAVFKRIVEKKPRCRKRASIACAPAPRRARRCRLASRRPSRRRSGSTFSTASARPRCCTSSFPTGPTTSATAPPASRCRATSSGSWTRRAIR
jgi:benzoate-CoA ligase